MIYRVKMKFDNPNTEFVKDFRDKKQAKEFIQKEIDELKNPFRLASLTSCVLQYVKTCKSDDRCRRKAEIWCL